MTAQLESALTALRQPGQRFEQLTIQAPRLPGLYAFYAPQQVLAAWPWDVPYENRPLYVGKSERSLNSRDVLTHFGTGKTGWSTVRRSLAVALKDELQLAAVPRNVTAPARPANFGLTIEGERRLSDWMREHLTLAFWVSPGGVDLGELETAVIDDWQPPLNIDKVRNPSQWMRAGRRAFADAVRAQTG
jgi:hypothetical protein